MFSLKKNIKLFTERLDLIAALAIFAMMSITFADVVLRLFRRPIPGSYEIVALLGAVAISFAMAHTSIQKGHVAVSLFVQLLPEKLQDIIECIITVFGIVLFALITWQSIIYAMECRNSGEVSMTLEMPFYPVIYGVAFGSGALCLALLVDLADALGRLKNR